MLKVIGRNHTPEDIEKAMYLARECGIECINMDLIAGLPSDTLDSFKSTVERVERLKPENTTVHTMSVKRSSKLNEELADYSLTEGDTVSDMVDYAFRSLTENSS